MNVLIIHPNKSIGESIEGRIKADGHRSALQTDFDDGIEAARAEDVYSSVLVWADAQDARSRINEIRRSGVKQPLIALLTAHGATGECRAAVLDAGADDVVNAPFDMSELLARVRAVTRRGQDMPANVKRVGSLEMDLGKKLVSAGSTPVHLTGKEYLVLEHLMLNAGRMCSKEAIFNAVYSLSNEDEPQLKIVDVFICKIRGKLKNAGIDPGHIHTHWGRGYRVQDPECAGS